MKGSNSEEIGFALLCNSYAVISKFEMRPGTRFRRMTGYASRFATGHDFVAGVQPIRPLIDLSQYCIADICQSGSRPHASLWSASFTTYAATWLSVGVYFLPQYSDS